MKHRIACLTLCVAAWTHAEPAVFTVTSSSFEGAGSIAEAVQLAEAAVEAGADGARIEFAFVTPTQIVFTSELFVSMTFDEGLELSIDGGDLVTLSGGATTRLFFVDGQRGLFPDPDGPSAHLSLANLTVRDGFSDDTGGAIWTDGTVSLDNVLMVDNLVEVPDDPFACLFDRECDGGGAVFVGEFGILTVDRSEFRDNAAIGGIGAYGGAISNAGAMAASDTFFFGNAVTDGGGAIGNGGLAVIFGCRFTANRVDSVIGAFDGGGAIQNGGVAASVSEFLRLVIANTEFEDNFTTGSAVDGGAIVSNGEMVIAQALFSGNYVDGSISDGGAIASNGGVLTVLNTTFSGNRVIGGGEGGALATGIGPATLVHVTVTDNEITDSDTLGGGGLKASTDPQYAVTAINSTFHGNRVTGASGADVSGVIDAVDVVIEDPTGVVLSSAMDVRLGDSAGNILTPDGAFPAVDLTLPLANNGGVTRTHAIEPSGAGGLANPLFDTGNMDAAQAAVDAISQDSAFYLDLIGIDLTTLTDQRGQPGSPGPRDDIGAFEYAFVVDGDGDTIPDADDNCLIVANESQIDADGDGFGNACDPDLNNDNIVNVVDLGLFRTVFFTADPVADFNADGTVNVIDLGILRLFFFSPPGP